jgi:hypothetical protein
MRLNSLYAIVAALGLLTACAHDTTAPLRPVGTYRLDRVNGSALPFIAENTSSGIVELTTGSLSLDVDGTFIGQVTYRQTGPDIATTGTQQASGTFALTGNGLTFTEDTGETFTGVFSGNRVTAQRDGITFEFVKQ